MKKYIEIKGASEHNLKNIDVQIEHNKITVVTGVSGSGKSSLVHDIISNESQRRYLESFSSYARQYLKQLKRPNVKQIKGLPAAISVNQRSVVRNPRSTVGTMTELYDYLRLLFARLGKAEKQIEKKIERRLFSFNSDYGACPNCKGLGVEDRIDPDKLISDNSKTLREGALLITTPNGYTVYSQVTVDVMNQICNAHGFHVDIPWKDLTPEQKDVVLYGTDKIKVLFGKHSLESRMKWTGITAKPREEGYYKGIIPVMEEILKRDRNANILRFVSSVMCSACRGKRLNIDALSVHFDGRTIADFSELTIRELDSYFTETTFSGSNTEIWESVTMEILKRTKLLIDLGLGYLTLSRESTTLSGGEAQRMRLANQAAVKLRGALYVMDEPSIGLHPHDTGKLLSVLNTIVSAGNTILITEHDESVIRYADNIIDIGPEAGTNGGELIFSGSLGSFEKTELPNSLTHQYLFREHKDNFQRGIRKDTGKFLRIKGAKHHNLKNIDVEIPLGVMTVVTGVSGAGKSSLIHGILANTLKSKLNGKSNPESGKYCEIEGVEQISKFIEIDQSPIGRTPRSNPATYTKLFDHIRDLFAGLDEAKSKGWKKGRFSFNNKGGRCEICQGAGYIQVGMHFMGNVDVICNECKGKRFNDDTLDVTYKGKNIYDVLEMSIDVACVFFEDRPKIMQYLSTLQKLGLGYITLGQPATTLSGGEAQRVKLAEELSKQAKGNTLYILDEPTTGLHMYDVEILKNSLQKLVDSGHTVILIEHHSDVILSADHIIDLGPGSGEEGGNVVVCGTPEDVMGYDDSLTGLELRKAFKNNSKINRSKIHTKETEPIFFKSVTTHNLKKIDVKIPYGKITVLTGVSGSGKSSLAFDTVYEESRKRYSETFSNYVRSLLHQKGEAEFEKVSGISPAIALDQHYKSVNPRSTLGTVTKIYDLYRLIYARAGKRICPQCKTQMNEALCPECGFKGKKMLFSSDFSFNHEDGACKECKGIGYKIVCNPEKLITHPEKPLLNGAMDGSKTGRFYGDSFGQYAAALVAVGVTHGIDYTLSWNALSSESKKIAMYGTGEQMYDVEWKYKRKNVNGSHFFKSAWKGFLQLVNEEFERKHADKRGDEMMPLMMQTECITCKGSRLNIESSLVLFKGKTIAGLSALSISNSIIFFENLSDYLKDESQKEIIEDSRKEILERLRILRDIGLPYLRIDRRTNTLSGGEARRMNLAGQIVSGLTEITYVLDEPSIGLHQKDTRKLIKLLHSLRKEGNTVIVNEHDREIIEAADHIIDMGPGAGVNGGKIIAKGSVEEIKKSKDSLTGKYLQTPIFVKRENRNLRPGIKIKGACAHNLKDIDLEIPSGGIIAVTGVSGSGKSSLISEVLFRSYFEKRCANCKTIEGLEQFAKVLNVDQSAPGQSSLSNVCTYTGIFDNIRKLFAETKTAKQKGFSKKEFSFNIPGGRCETCKGTGKIKTSMDFLSDVWHICEDCKGKRFRDEILDIQYLGKNIHEILNLTISDAGDMFKETKPIFKTLNILSETGLEYITLGQTLDTFSGGELQRLKLASALNESAKGNNLYLLDEPTTGLHFKDIETLIILFEKLVRNGHTVVVIEHNEDLIRHADLVIELGPEGGEKGGYLMS